MVLTKIMYITLYFVMMKACIQIVYQITSKFYCKLGTFKFCCRLNQNY